MESIGQYLKEIRDKRNLSLEELANKTKIQIKNLISIEDNNFDNLGGKGYAKAMIITYARYVEADVDAVLEEFEKTYQEIPDKLYRSRPVQPKKYLISTNLLSFIFFVILIIVVIVISVKFYKDGKFKSPFQRSTEEKIEKEEEKPESISTLIPELELVSTKQKEEPLPELIQEALHDTTDYLDQLLFTGENSPFDYDP